MTGERFDEVQNWHHLTDEAIGGADRRTGAGTSPAVEVIAGGDLVRRVSGALAGCREAMVMAAGTVLSALMPMMEVPDAPERRPVVRVLAEARPDAVSTREPIDSSLNLLPGPVRVVTSVPLSVVVADNRVAVLGGPAAGAPGLVVSAPDQVRAVAELFEWIWELAPVSAEPSAQDVRAIGQRRAAVLAGLADGLTDAAVAARLDLAERTVRRDVRKLMEVAGVVSRFQLGVRARALGWLPEPGRPPVP
ncbi:DNA-binding response regulator, NarL/FixJ family, contains REC and HTH domains [Asanoa hainanensis]|uniref:DNA-binding response regulator, NarL/FixJ family, contains REC and HTH domains n=1 Tax=Asanoa hainanensis TaxID=560556 RepID=A0A239PF48_9ACTN|nr:LuxR C-terminal-related transcriptional regulator [Asanoa hainanensis]SNT65495.1 DNA-binding response regulator, NarL/FixJ family, contains REC and HTH domains [Asanoa hainanensis]